MALIECEGIGRECRSGQAAVTVLDGVDLRIERNEYVALTGVSGSGKSSLLHLIGLLDVPSRGRLCLAGLETGALTPDQRAILRCGLIGFVFQAFHLLPRASALENVELPMLYAAVPTAERRERALRMLELVGLGHRTGHLPCELSGGEQQRVAIARAMVMEPRVVLADEPTGSLDSRTGQEVIGLLEQLHTRGSALVVVTHDAAIAARAQRRIVLADGRVETHEPAATTTPAENVALTTVPAISGMTWRGHVGTALRALRVAPLRSGLTALGIVIGVAAVLVQGALGAGAERVITEQIEALGSRLLLVQAGTSIRDGVRLGVGSRPTLDIEDARALAAAVPGVQAVAAAVSAQAQVVSGNRNWSTLIGGASPDYLHVRDWPVARGRPFTVEEDQAAAKVALVGTTVSQKLFDDGDPVAREIRIGNVPFTIIGALAPKGFNAMSGRDQDDLVVVPLRTAQLRLLGREGPARRSVDFMLVKAAVGTSIAEMGDSVRVVLRARHGLPTGAPDDFSLQDPASEAEAQRNAIRSLTWLLIAVASVSLVVGGVSIMNIMLVSVAERTREIGLRVAVGARPRDIGRQFLVEAITLCAVGGAVGVMLGTVVALSIAWLIGWAVVITPSAALAAVLFAGIVGVVFGFLPARRAAQLDPIAALRHE